MATTRSAQLTCPACQGERALSPFTWHGVSVDVCSRCHGVWCDYTEMLFLEEADTLENIDLAFKGEYQLIPVEHSMADGLRACPRDGELLARHEWRGDTRIVLDCCKACQGTWLDAGELEGYAQHLKELNQHTPVLTEAEKARGIRRQAEDEAEIRAFVDRMDYGLFTPLFRQIGEIQKKLGLY